MKKLALVISTLAVSAVSASAADMAARPVYTKAAPAIAPMIYNWTGFYVGVNGGYGGTDTIVFGDTEDSPMGVKPRGGFGGGQIGYNWQFDSVVFGLEADVQASDIHQSIVDLNFGDPFSTKVDWFGTARGRLGYAFAGTPLLAYLTGGLAFGNVVNDAGAGSLNGAPYHYDDIRTGYALGGGLEYKFAPAWSIKAEYQYINLGTANPTNSAGVAFSGGVLNHEILRETAFHTGRVGLNYSFNSPVVAKY